MHIETKFLFVCFFLFKNRKENRVLCVVLYDALYLRIVHVNCNLCYTVCRCTATPYIEHHQRVKNSETVHERAREYKTSVKMRTNAYKQTKDKEKKNKEPIVTGTAVTFIGSTSAVFTSIMLFLLEIFVVLHLRIISVSS